MHDHARHSLSTIADPEVGAVTRFWDGETQWTIDPHFDRWIVHRHYPGGATPLVTLHRKSDGWTAVEVNGFEEWSGASVQDVLRRLL